jgi:alkanesulfonate monooxygenase SsuD/methylene tetrahydromethanopterin reductase-like flavin-dependent oxidoreductase (luciferase family)
MEAWDHPNRRVQVPWEEAMRIGIGLPASIPGVRGNVILDWARRADAGPFSSLGIIDRIVFSNYEPLIALAAAAGATQRIRLMTTVLLAPLRNTGILAKQAASLDALSGGRLTLGLGIGGREDDFRAASASFRDRGRRFEEQLARMKQIWLGEPPPTGGRPIGPPPARSGGPEVLIGGSSSAAVRRVGRWADGYIAGVGTADSARKLYVAAAEAWRAEGRPGKPRFVTCMYFGLGPDAAEGIGAYIRSYYGYMGPRVESMVDATPATPDAVERTIQAFADAGADELMLWPCMPQLDQVDRLAALVRPT